MEMTLPQPCPECGVSRSLTLRTVLAAKPLDSYSIAGVQDKVVASEAAEVRCSRCDWSRPGRLEGVEVSPDGQAITAGHFVGEGD